MRFKNSLSISHQRKQFVCAKCNKGFANNATLQKHSVVHTREKTYRRTVCDKTLGLKTSLTRHKLRHTSEENHMDDPEHKCFTCFTTFPRKDFLRTHVLKHSEETIVEQPEKFR